MHRRPRDGHSAVLTASTDQPTSATRGADNDRTSWYPDETTLTPSLVSGGTFGQLFKTAVNGQVYGQPLLDDGQVLVNTENDWAYGVNPVTGAIDWSRNFGTPTLASQIGGVGCADLTPNIGITGTPVVDQTTDIEYLVDNQYISGTSGPQAYYMQALELDDNGAEAPGFPVQIQGGGPEQRRQRVQSRVPAAAARPSAHERRGLRRLRLPLRRLPVAGVDRRGDRDGHPPDHVDHHGGRLLDHRGRHLAGRRRTGLRRIGHHPVRHRQLGGPGNGPIAGDTPPADLGESVVRLNVQSNGTLKPVDFFSPTDNWPSTATTSTSARGPRWRCPTQYFGTTTYPDLAVAVGKEGYVYLLNRATWAEWPRGPDGSDNVLGRFGPNGGVWSSPAVWPGNGGWIYLPTASGSVVGRGSRRATWTPTSTA